MIRSLEELRAHMRLCEKHDNQGGWMSKEPMNPEGFEGFTYALHLPSTDKFYVGSKVYWFNKTLAPLKGKKRKRKQKVPSDWLKYYGSSNEFKVETIVNSKENVDRYHIYDWKTKRGLQNGEALLQCHLNVLLESDPINGFLFYNKQVGRQFRPITGALKELQEYMSNDTTRF